MNIDELIKKQRDYFKTHQTKNISFRINKLNELKKTIKENETQISEALQKDLGKCETESYMTEIGMVLDDLGYIIKHTRKWCKKQWHLTPFAQFPSSSYQVAEPYGLTLIISPWNYPFLLTMQPLIGSICAGNCAIIKPSEHSPNTSKVIKNIIGKVFEEQYVETVLGNQDVCQELLNHKFDYILVQKDVKEEFITSCKKYIENFLGENWNENTEYPKIINKKQFDRIVNLIDERCVLYGGNYDKKNLKIQPTLLEVKEDL